MQNKNILIIDDDDVDGELYSEWLSAANTEYEYHVTQARTLADGLDIFLRSKIDCVLLDYKLGGDSGLEFFEKISRPVDQIPVLFMTAFPEETLELESVGKGAQFFIYKNDVNQKLLAQRVSDVIGFSDTELLAANHSVQEILARWGLSSS